MSGPPVHQRIETVEQLDALPHGTLLVREYTSAAGWKLNEVWERHNKVWHCLAAPLSPPSRHDGIPTLPAKLVWHPSWHSAEGVLDGR
ncbi:hypothetical protein NIIDNTM18_42420 [Mycolicibacterium litorale]|uniref:Uncharacterized protein n=1 Tax=Mycolicibacterium litorale TaxID=758802 RepID=A0A6S6P8H7_9MYCO|nr:hypothetical protein NIIDNTM18_42420 [Mycolicibacterium litorale]